MNQTYGMTQMSEEDEALERLQSILRSETDWLRMT